jgi:hypothetical protein
MVETDTRNGYAFPEVYKNKIQISGSGMEISQIPEY